MKTLNKNLAKSLAITFLLLFSFGKINAQNTIDQNSVGIPLPSTASGNALFGISAGGNPGTPSGLFNSSGYNNTYIGILCGSSTTTGYDNTFLGSQAGYGNTSGYRNTFLGVQSGVTNTTGYENTFSGYFSGSGSTGIKNTFTGAFSGNGNTDDNNSFYGYKSGQASSGNNNTFMGYFAGEVNTGDNNVFVGSSSGILNTSGYWNTFLGSLSGDENTTGVENVFIGRNAGTLNNSGDRNTFIGNQSGAGNTSGAYNTFMGYEAGDNVTTGQNNVILGAYAGNNAFNAASSGLVLLGAGADAGTGITYTNAGAIGYNALVTADDCISIGTTGNGTITTAVCIGATAPWTGTGHFYVNGDTYNTSGAWLTSDIKFKTDVKQINTGLDLINKLNPVSYFFKPDTFFNFPTELQYGFIAQELKTVMPNLVNVGENGIHSVNYSGVIPMLTKAIQEQQAIIEQSKLENANLNAKLISLENKLNNNSKLLEEKLNEMNRGIANLNACCEMSKLGKTTSNDKTISTIVLNNSARLDQNKPNPFANETYIDYYIPSGSDASKIEILDQLGKKVMIFNITNFGEGRLIVKNNGLAQGIYTYQLVSGNKVISNYKMQIVHD